MTHSPNPTLRLAIALALIAAALDLIPRLTGLEGGITGLPGLLALRKQEGTRGRDLDEGQAAARDRHAERDRVIEDVIAGQRTLQSGADALRALYARAPQSERDTLRKLYPARSEEETYCRAVIGFVAVALEDRPEEVRPVVARLEKELRGRMPDGPSHRMGPVATGRQVLVLSDPRSASGRHRTEPARPTPRS
jgi:hypothetical protein